ncbi:MAG: T9SS type A sorting domain-containing protein [Ignavibacteriales bacterium]|nr:T9SS type A sorting domain-containing protein [Ignavibacteriales bacterium]
MRTLISMLALFCVLVLTSHQASSQWRSLYATYDDDTNGTGHNTTSVGVISEDTFVALVLTTNVRNFLIPYTGADSAQGRVNFVGYGGATSGVFQFWTDGGFDQIEMRNARKVVATPDSLVYVANNDPDHNILVFKFTGDSVEAVPPYRRQPTGTNSIFGLAVDGNGYVYVGNDTTTGKTDDVKIYNPIGQWNDTHTDSPVRTIDLPDGIYRGVAVTPNGGTLFIADYGQRKILKLTGSPTAGYTQDPTFNFQLGSADSIEGITTLPSVIGLGYLPSRNILFAACDIYFGGGSSYPFGRAYLINPHTGSLVSTDSSISVIDAAKWNFTMTGGYNLRSGGTSPGNASGYTSLYDVGFDEKGNVYTQSHYGWTVDKWTFDGTLPTITTVERISSQVPELFKLHQNFPNPFNPTTTIAFDIRQPGHVLLKVTDVLGREVKTLVNEAHGPGSYKVTFDAGGLPSGTYLYSLQTGESSTFMKMLLVK